MTTAQPSERNQYLKKCYYTALELFHNYAEVTVADLKIYHCALMG